MVDFAITYQLGWGVRWWWEVSLNDSGKVSSHGHMGPSFEFMNSGSGWLTFHPAHCSCRTLRTFFQPSLSHKGCQMLAVRLLALKCHQRWSCAVTHRCVSVFWHVFFILWSWVSRYVWNWELRASHKLSCTDFQRQAQDPLYFGVPETLGPVKIPTGDGEALSYSKWAQLAALISPALTGLSVLQILKASLFVSHGKFLALW